eukprot:SAG11_NODE_274_length_11310_cov_4.717510_4_plen_137_part_00
MEWTDEELWDSLGQAQLFDAIKAEPEQLQAQVGEGGAWTFVFDAKATNVMLCSNCGCRGGLVCWSETTHVLSAGVTEGQSNPRRLKFATIIYFYSLSPGPFSTVESQCLWQTFISIASCCASLPGHGRVYGFVSQP